MKQIWGYIFFNSVLLAFSFHSHAEEISDYAIEQSYEHAKRVIQEYPSDKNFVLGFGISTVPFATSMRLQLPEAARDDYFRELPVQGIHHEGAEQQTRHQALEKLIPDTKTLNGRTLVIHRVLDEGQSISDFIPDLMSFMREHRPGIKVKFDFVLGHPIAYSQQFLKTAVHRANRGITKDGIRISLEDDFKIMEDPRYSENVTWDVVRGDASALIKFGRYSPFQIDDAAREDFELQENAVRAAMFERKIETFILNPKEAEISEKQQQKPKVTEQDRMNVLSLLHGFCVDGKLTPKGWRLE